MDNTRVDIFIMNNQDNLPRESLMILREKLKSLPEDRWYLLSSIEFKNPIISLILSLLLGSWGIDRFFVGDTGLGILKLLTCGGIGIWTIVDWFLIMGITKRKNFEKFILAV